MSEDFLKRWSQRKRDAAEAEQARRPAPENAAGDERSSEPVEAIKPAEPPNPPLDLKDLPPIESITAATDIRPFLQPGVPVDIARAALRRAWSADPRIRDFVGLADYDWDYHAVGGAAGFGPLEMTDELRQAVARNVRMNRRFPRLRRKGRPRPWPIPLISAHAHLYPRQLFNPLTERLLCCS